MYGFRTPFGGDSAALVVVLILLLTVTMASTGSGSYRIRSRPPNLGNKQQLSASSNRSQQQQQHWQDVYIAGFFALSDHEIEASLGLGVMPAINLALRHLANSTLLHDYRLRLLHNDTQVSYRPFDHRKITCLLSLFSLAPHILNWLQKLPASLVTLKGERPFQTQVKAAESKVVAAFVWWFPRHSSKNSWVKKMKEETVSDGSCLLREGGEALMISFCSTGPRSSTHVAP